MAERRAAEAFAKVNLSLVVASADRDGYHPLVSLAQSVSWADYLELGGSEDEDEFASVHMEGKAEDNLAWRAAVAVREAVGSHRGLSVSLTKNIPVAAGLGGGSADAAAALGLAAGYFGVALGGVAELAVGLGADVPFCLQGGLAIMEGRGERLTPQPALAGYALAIAVPPVELLTAEVYGRWDALDEPIGPTFPTEALPPGLRAYEPLRNDLASPAEDLQPLLGEWRAELAARWDRPVAMSGSGPALFAYFLDEDEAKDALHSVPAGARGAQAVVPVPQGWRPVPVH